MIFSTVIIASLLSLLSFARAAAIPTPSGVHYVCPDFDTAKNPLIQPSPVPSHSPLPTPLRQSSPSPVPTSPGKHSGDGKSPKQRSDGGKSPSNDGKPPSNDEKSPSNGGKLPSGDDKFKYLSCAYTANDHCTYDKVRADPPLTCNSANLAA